MIAGNTSIGISVSEAGTNDTIIAGNRVGLNALGAPVANGNNGIQISTGPQRTRIGTNGDGVSDSLERNVVSGNGAYGIAILGSGTTDTVVAGNYLGTNVAGTTTISNLGFGIAVFSSALRTRIGTDGNNNGSDANERNVISGNGNANIWIAAPQVVVAGNYIGTNSDGSSGLPYFNTGIYLSQGAQDVRVGTDGNGVADTLERNVISGNAAYGIYAAGDMNSSTNAGLSIAGNYIGLNASGSGAVTNASGGILINSGFKGTRIGTDGSNDAFNVNERNVISGNSGVGIYVLDSTLRTPSSRATLSD